MDPQLKERLIGAAVLVALGVWLIPLVLDGPATPLEEDGSASFELPLPAESSAMRRQTVELGTQATTVTNKDAVAVDTAPAAADDAVVATAPESELDEPEPVEPVRAVARTESVAAATVVSGDWMVQLGSFGDRENAERLAMRVTSFGMTPQVSTFTAGGRVMYRVRVGPHETRERAEAAKSSLSAHGFVAQVVSNN
jgi:DedD protein